MATAEQYVKAQNGAVKLALRELLAFWRTLDLSDGLGARVALERFWPELLARYGEITVTLAADRFEEITGLPATLVRPVDPERANARMRWALAPLFGGDQVDAIARMQMLTDELVKQPGRSTVIRSAADNRIMYARVPTGRETCAFCLMLASRGPVYASEESAGTVTGNSLGGRDYKKLRRLGDTTERREAIFSGARRGAKAPRARAARKGAKASLGGKFHADCDCRLEAIASPNDLERLRADGYDPEALYERYAQAQSAGGGSLRETLAHMREQQGIH